MSRIPIVGRRVNESQVVCRQRADSVHRWGQAGKCFPIAGGRSAGATFQTDMLWMRWTRAPRSAAGTGRLRPTRPVRLQPV